MCSVDNTAKGVSDIVPMQDLFNEWHANNTSEKVRGVMRSKGNSGRPLTTNPPFGYEKDGKDKEQWVVDEEAAKVVRRIYAACVKGFGPMQIAKQLKADKVPTPTEYWSSIGRKCGNLPKVPFNWCAATVAEILDKQEYAGDTVNFRTATKSLKQKKRIDNPQEKWSVFPDTHPAIIDRETFELVQKLRKERRRPTRTGILSMFSGLLYCADCGEKLYYSVTNNYKRDQAYFFCSSYRKNSDVCSAHYIREKVVEQLVLESLRRVLWYVQCCEKQFAQRQREQSGEARKTELAEKRRELEKVKRRILGLDDIIQKLYEDSALGRISDERYATLSVSMESEQRALKATMPELENAISTSSADEEGLQRFIEKVRRITRVTELTPELVHEFIEKVIVSKPDNRDGKR
jgi:site-specific DNA recombinase